MKKSLIKIIKTLLILIISILIIYLILTLNRFLLWCNRNQILLFNNNISPEYILDNVDINAINSLGGNIEDFANTLDESKLNVEAFKGDGNFTFTKDGKTYSFAEYYNSIGFSVWTYLSSEFQTISLLYVDIAILWGIILTVFYIIASNEKINYNVKFVIGYFVIIIFIVQMYGYLKGIFYGFIDSIRYMPVFYIIYTMFFIIIYFINRKKYKEIINGLNNKIFKDNNK